MESQQDFQFDVEEDDLMRLDNELIFNLFYPVQNNVALFIDVSAIAEIDLHAEDGDETSTSKLELNEAWILVDQWLHNDLAVQIGRQNISELREWWWDADLDAARLLYGQGDWKLQVGIAERLVRVDTEEKFIDPEDDDVLQVFVQAEWELGRRSASGRLFFVPR